jgi:hypothetical protein
MYGSSGVLVEHMSVPRTGHEIDFTVDCVCFSDCLMLPHNVKCSISLFFTDVFRESGRSDGVEAIKPAKGIDPAEQELDSVDTLRDRSSQEDSVR